MLTLGKKETEFYDIIVIKLIVIKMGAPVMRFKISILETHSEMSIVEDIKNLINNLEFSVNISKNNNNQITYNLDSEISERLGRNYKPLVTDTQVYVGDKQIGNVDIALSSNNATSSDERGRCSKRFVY